MARAKTPETKARYALARRVRDPLLRLNALTLTLRERDLTEGELATMIIAAEQVRAATAILRRGMGL